MFRIDGTVVSDNLINEMPWTIGRYLRSLRKSAGQVKFRVGYYYRVSSNSYLDCQYLNLM